MEKVNYTLGRRRRDGEIAPRSGLGWMVIAEIRWSQKTQSVRCAWSANPQTENGCRQGDASWRENLPLITRLTISNDSLMSQLLTKTERSVQPALGCEIFNRYDSKSNQIKSNSMYDTNKNVKHKVQNSKKMKKALREMQTLRAGCSKAEPKVFAPQQTPFPGARDGQNLISWRRSLPLSTNPVRWGSMDAISSYSGNRPTDTHTHKPTDKTDYNTLHR